MVQTSREPTWTSSTVSTSFIAYFSREERQFRALRSFSVDRIRHAAELDEAAQDIAERELDDQYASAYGMRISLDLDDGVKVNYGKFGDLLSEVKVVTGGAGDD